MSMRALIWIFSKVCGKIMRSLFRKSIFWRAKDLDFRSSVYILSPLWIMLLIKKSLPKSRFQRFSNTFSFDSFVVLHLTFKYVTCFELIVMCGERRLLCKAVYCATTVGLKTPLQWIAFAVVRINWGYIGWASLELFSVRLI
jgi:hypothetical protein